MALPKYASASGSCVHASLQTSCLYFYCYILCAVPMQFRWRQFFNQPSIRYTCMRRGISCLAVTPDTPTSIPEADTRHKFSHLLTVRITCISMWNSYTVVCIHNLDQNDSDLEVLRKASKNGWYCFGFYNLKRCLGTFLMSEFADP